MSPRSRRMVPATVRKTLVSSFLLILLGRPPCEADDRFFPVTSKAHLSATSLGTPSTNERGDVVFRVITSSQRSIRVIRGTDQINAANETTPLPTYTARTSSGTLAAFSTINASGSVLTYNFSSGFQIVQRLDPTDTDPITGPGNYLSQAIARAEGSQSPPAPFAFVSPIGGISDSGMVHFYTERVPLSETTLEKAIYTSATELTHPAGATPLASTYDNFSTLEGYVSCSADGATAVWRGTGPDGLGIYASGGHPGATPAAWFSNTGIRPSVNTLGHLAVSATYGAPPLISRDGVFIRHLDGTVRRAGNLNNAGDLLAPVGVLPASHAANSGDRVALNEFGQVMFAAFDVFGRRTLYTTSLGRCRPILSVGDEVQLAGATHEVAAISLFDGLKKNGQGVFWISTAGGQEFVLRAIRGFSQTKLSDSPVNPSYAMTKYLLRSIPAEESRLNAPLIARGKTLPSGKIKAIGCNLTSTANLLTAYGNSVSAGELQSWLLDKWNAPPAGRSREDFVKTLTNDLVEGAIELYSRERQVTVPEASVVRFTGMHNPGAAGAQTNFQKLVSELRQGYPVKIRVPNGGYGTKPYNSFGHYVLAYGLKDPGKSAPLDTSDILIHDPGNGGIYTLLDYGTQLPKAAGSPKYDTAHPNWLEDNAGGRRRLHLYRILPPGSDIPPTMNLLLSTQPAPLLAGSRSIVGSRAYLLVTDSLGRRLGTGPDGTEYTEIPGGSFFIEEPFTGLDGDEGETEQAWEGYQARYNLNLTDLPAGSYTVKVTAVDAISYALEPGSTGAGATVPPEAGTLAEGQSFSSQFTIGTDTGDDSRLSIERIDAVTAKLTLHGKTGTNYQLRAAGNLQDWSDVGGVRAGADALIDWTVPIISGGPSFYRVESSTP